MHNVTVFLNNIAEAIPIPIAVLTGADLRIELANHAMIKAWGKGDQVIGRNYIDLVPEIEKQQIFNQALNVFKTGIPFHVKGKKTELEMDGIITEYYYNYSFIPLYDKGDNICGVINTKADVTDLYRAKEQAEDANAKLNLAIETSGIGMYEIDLDTKLIKTSGAFNSILSVQPDITSEELIAKLYPDGQTKNKQGDETLVNSKIHFKTRIINNEQSDKWTKINSRILNCQSGNPKIIIGIIQDIKDLREVEEEQKKEVAQHTDDLERSNNDLMHFASIVSHDLREPLRKIKIFNNYLKEPKKNDSTKDLEKYHSKIDQSSKRMENIIEGILAYSTMDKTTQYVDKIDLNEVFQNIKIDLELVINEKDATLIIWEIPEIEGALILITQLFYNLIQNALKFSKPNQSPKVIISSQRIKINGVDSLEIIIKDNGIGFDPALNERIFNAFERLHSRDQYEGNGLGLALCRKIAKRHNGTITAVGEKDKGAEFTVTLPLTQDDVNI